MRATAPFALAQIGGERAKRALMQVADDSDPRVRQIATPGPSAGSRPVILEEPDDELDSRDDDEGEGVA